MKNVLRKSNFGFTKWCVGMALLRSEPRRLNRNFGGLRGSLLLALTVGWMGGGTGFAQTAPTAQSLPFNVNFGTTTFTTLPAGVAVWNGLNGGSVSTQTLAEGSAPTANATLAVATASTTSGGAFGYSAASDGKLYIQTSSNASNGVNQPVIAIVTTGGSGITLAYTVDVINASPRTVGVVAQYRVGTSGGWTTLVPTSGLNPFSQAGGTAGLKTTASVTLPSAADNQPVVQIRWAVWRGAETGNSSGLALDNISVTTAPAVAPAAPVVAAATGNTTTGFTANWAASSGATKYYLDVATDSGVTVFVPNFSNLDVGNVTTYAVTGLSAGTTYYYKVRASNSAGPSASSGAQTALTTAAGTPSVTVSPTSATGLTNYVGQVSASTNYTVTGANLGGTNLVVTASTNAIEVSTNSSTGFTNTFSLAPSVDGTLSNTVYVRISASAPVGAVSGTVSNVSGSASNNFTISGTVTQPALTLVLSPTSVQESAGAGASTGTVGIPFSLTNDLTVSLVSSNTAAATVPSTVTITNGQTNATFTIAAVANTNSYTNETAVITASQTDYTSASATLTVGNVDVPSISLKSLATDSYTQSFDALGINTISGAISATAGAQASLATATGSSTLNGWYATKAGGDGTTPTAITPDAGGTGSGFVYSYGAASASDRALGMLASGSNWMAIGALIKNDTGGAIDGIKVSFTAEFWRSSTTTQNVLTCAIGKVDGTTITTGNFLTAGSAAPFISGNITGPAAVTTSAALNGNDVVNQSTFTDVVIPLVLAPGETGFVRWSDVNDGGNDAGLAIDNLKMTAVVSSVPTPEFSLAGGIYLSDQNLKVSNFGGYAAGTTVYYTVDGSTPTSGSTVYNNTTGIALPVGNGPVAVKVIAIQGGLESFITSATYDLPKDVANLTALRASATGSTIYRVTGPVTFTAGTAFRKTKFFQDSGAGIQIDDLGVVITTPYLAGDNVSNILGRILLYQGQLQMVPLRDFGPAVSSGNSVAPLSRTLATLTDADQSRLVTIPGVEYQGANGTLVFTTATATINTAVRDSSTGAPYSGWVRNIFSDSDVTGKVIPTGFVTVTGIVQKTLIGSVQSLTVGPRNSADAGAPPALAFAWSVDLEIPESGLEYYPEDQYLTLSRVGNSTGELQVLISCNPENRLSIQNGGVLPQTITIPAGTTSAQIKLMPVNDSVYRGNTLVTIAATAANHTGATASATILEDDVPDTIKPGIALIGANPLLLANGASYTDPGATVTDNVDATRTITGAGTVNTAVQGDYTVTYNATDAAGNVAIQVTRTVRVAAPLGTTYSGWLNGASPSDAALLDYVFGAVTPGTLDPSLRPTVAVTGGYLVLTYYVREGTVGLTVTPKTSSDLALGAGGWSTADDVAEVATTTVNGVSVRKHTASVLVSGVKKFLRIEAVQQ